MEFFFTTIFLIAPRVSAQEFFLFTLQGLHTTLHTTYTTHTTHTQGVLTKEISTKGVCTFMLASLREAIKNKKQINYGFLP